MTHPKIKEEVQIIGVMEKKEINPPITIKELFERLVQLETKLDMKTQNDVIVAKRFKGFSYIIIIAEIVNFIFNYLILKGHLNILDYLK